MKNLVRHLSSFIAPVTVTLIIPYLILSYEKRPSNTPWLSPSILNLIIGTILSVAGFILVITTIRLFIRIGNGTIMPWDPTRRMIIAGFYGYVRNPMILSLLILLLGESILFASNGIAIMAILFFLTNTIYFKLSEEPGLEKRFGTEYKEYKEHVPMWIPRLTPWKPHSAIINHKIK